VISREQAMEISAAAARPLPAEEIDTAAAGGRVLAEDAVAGADLPPFDRALRDGYALRSSDTAGASANLRVVGTLVGGEVAGSAVGPGECWRVMTGAPVPPGADAIVMQEEVDETSPAFIQLRRPVDPGRYIARTGDEIRRGEVLARTGSRLDPVALGLALASGLARLRVHRRPRVSLLATGSELVPPHETPGPGRIRASNPWMLGEALARAGAEVNLLGLVSDREEEQRPRLADGLEAGVLIVSGGTGRGRADHAEKLLRECGVEILYHGVAVDPGRPAIGGRRGDTLVFGLPGTPLAAWVLWRVLVAPCLRRLAGESEWRPRLGRARLASPLEHARGREVWAPADLSWAGVERVARPRVARGCGGLRQQIGDAALVRIPPGDEERTPAGSLVEVLEGEA
jgi:molybdopterin molybdotransferase